MTFRIGIRPATWALLLLAVVPIAPVGSMRSCRADVPAAQRTGAADRTGVLAYIAWQELESTLMDATELRLAATAYLRESLRSQGHVLVPQEALSPLVTRWRLRSSLMLRDEFLTELRDELAGDRLFLAQLMLQPEGLLVAWRLVDTATGTVLHVGFCRSDLTRGPLESERRSQTDTNLEPELPEINRWLAAAERASESLLLPASEPSARPNGGYLLMPARSVGSDRGGTILATHILMEELVERGGYALPDPGLVVTTIQGAGFATDEVSVATRSLLRDRFGSRTALVGELIAYDIEDFRTTSSVSMDDESMPTGLQQVDEFALSLTEIDLESGFVLASDDVYENRSVVEGWFGRQHRHSLLERLQTTVAELWTMNDRTQKDGGDDSPR